MNNENSVHINRFNIRVYGIVVNEKTEVLLCSEEKDGMKFTKFPGGGLEYGEGIIDCLVREFREELDTEIENIRHFYTTEKFQQSAFIGTDQIISVYYLLDLIDSKVKTGMRNNLYFFWKPLLEFKTEDLTFPIDKLVAEKILKIL